MKTCNIGITIRKIPTRTIMLLGGVLLISATLFSCSTCCLSTDFVGTDYTPSPGGWDVSTPEARGLDPELVDRLYCNASKLETLYGLLIIKDGYLIAEGYFNGTAMDQMAPRQSVTKSVTSALVGLAIEQGHIESVDQKMLDFFPELEGQISDPRKKEITIRHLLQMRAGYPNEEKAPEYLDRLFFEENWHWIPHIEDFPLVQDPGTEFDYSNLTSHILGIIVSRASGTDLKSFAREHLLGPIGAEAGDWTGDADGYNWGWGEIYITARDMARFGLLYLNDGEWRGEQVIPPGWVRDSHADYSKDFAIGGWSSSRYGDFRNLGYGYQWWSAEAGRHEFTYANGHGGQLIVLLKDLDMIIVTTADPLKGPDLAGAGGWKYEGAIINTIAKFIRSLPAG